MERWKRGCLISLALCLCISLKLQTAAQARMRMDFRKLPCRTQNADQGILTETEELELYARSAVLMDGDSGRVLYAKNAQEELPMASTTKIMTCIVALEQSEPDRICTVSERAAMQPKVRLGMKKGDRFYLKDLLYSLMLESHNDTAVCIAENIGGSVEAFADLMNEKAAQLGCSHTYYITPNGLDEQDERGIHHTTAKELAEVMRYCLAQSPCAQEFLEITRTASYTFSDAEGTKTYGCTNHNALLNILDGAVSGKTGFTGNAGYCYIGAVRQEDKFLIVSLLACGWPNNRGYKWVDTKRLVHYGTENFEKRNVIDTKVSTDAVGVKNGTEAEVETQILWNASDSEQHTIQQKVREAEYAETVPVKEVLMRKGEAAECRIQLKDTVTAPAEAGTRVGSVTFRIDGIVYADFPVVTAEPVNKRNYVFCFVQFCLDFVNFMTKKLAIFG